MPKSAGWGIKKGISARWGITLALFLVLLAGCGQPDPLAYARAQQALQAEQRAAQQAQARQEALEPYQRVAAVAWWLFLAAVPLVALVVVVDAYRVRRRPLVRPDQAGQLPVPRAMVDRGELVDAFTAALAAFHTTQLALAQRPIVDKLTIAQHGASTPALLPSMPTVDAPSPQALPVPTFAQLLDRGTIYRDGPLILGYADGQPLTGTWRDLYSSAIAGVSGSGKTTTIRFLACQSALHGARFVSVDPHMDTGDDSLAATLAPLQGSMLCQPAGTDADILQAVRLVRSQLSARIAGDKTRTPLVLCVDEFTRCMRSSAIAGELAGLVEAIGQEGRKVGIFAMLAGQVWTAERAGGTPLRDALASCYVHRIKRRQANMLLQLGDELPETLTLATGTAVLYRTSGELETVTIPYTSSDDVRHVAGLLLPTPATAPVLDVTPLRAEVAAEVGAEVADAAPLRAHQDALDPRSLRVRELLRAGTPQRDILREVWGISGTGGDAYTKASAELRAIVARLV